VLFDELRNIIGEYMQLLIAFYPVEGSIITYPGSGIRENSIEMCDIIFGI
jgi:hypothetical protein